MVNRPRAIGTAAETAVCRYLAAHGFPHAERRSLKGSLDQGDITGTPGVVWEVKGGQAAKTASDGLVAEWLAETDTERVNAGCNVGVLVLQRAGIGPANAGRWWAVLHLCDVAPREALAHRDLYVAPVRMHLSDAVLLLRARGYGQPLDPARTT